MRPREIDDFEFVWMLLGQAVLLTRDEEILLAPGQLLLVSPGVRHSFIWDQRRASRHGYVHFFPEEARGTQEAKVRVRRMSQHDPLAGLCAYLIWLGREQPDGWHDEVKRTLRFLLAVFTSGPVPDDGVRTGLPAPLIAVVEHLRREWSQMPLRRVSVDELTSSARVSRSYLNRLFQRSSRSAPLRDWKASAVRERKRS